MKRQSLALPIARRPGRGWLVLIGGTSDTWRATEPIDRAAIELMQRDAPIAFVPAANCPPEYGTSFLAMYGRLGAADGYVVPITGRASAHDAQNGDLLRNAGLIYFGGGETTALLESLTDTPALAAIAEAYERGAVVAGMSAGAIALAARGLSLGAGVLQGWAWLPQLLVSVHHTPDREGLFESALRDHPDLLGLALPEDTALALGPDGEVEAWGDREITVKARMSFRAQRGI
jgi:cyanophycinase